MTSSAVREILQFRFSELKSKSLNERLINAYDILLHGNAEKRSKSWWVSVLIADLCNVNANYSPKLSFDDLKSYIVFIKK